MKTPAPIPSAAFFKKLLSKGKNPCSTHTIPMKNSSVKFLLFVLAFAALLAVPAAQAATVTWVGNTSNLWNVAANWSTGAIPANGATLLFGTPGTSGLAIVDDIPTLTVGGAGTDGIVFNSTSGVYSISKTGTTLTLGSSAGGIAVKDTSLVLQTISSQLNYSGGQTVQVGNTTGAALSSLILSGSQTSGTPRLTKTGTGLLSLNSGTNTLGGLTINQGTVNIGADNNLSTAGTAPATPTAGWLVLNGGALRTNLNVPFAINANRGIALGDGTAGSGGTINAYASDGTAAYLKALTYNGVIANNGGTNSLTKTGIQVLALGGANTYTGATKINQGQLTLDFSATGAPTSNIISSSSNLVMGDLPTSLSNAAAGAPYLLVQGSNTATTSQTFAGASFNPGNSNVMARGGSSTFDTTLALGAVTHTAGGVVGFSLMTGGSSGKGVITTTTANTNGILGGWATSAAAVGTGTVPLAQTDWAANDGSGNIVAYTGYTIPTGVSPTLANNAVSNVKIDATSTLNVTPTFVANVSDLNTIMVAETGATLRTIAVGAGNTLRLGAFGGIWKSSGTGGMTIGVATSSGGTLTAGGAANTAGEIVFNAGTAAITVNSVIADNGTGVVSMTKTGGSTLVLASNNTFTGGAFIDLGGVNANTAGAFGGAGRNVTVMTGATVNLNTATGGLTYANNFNLAGSALTMGGAGGAVITTVGNTVSGTVTLSGDTTIGSSGTNGTISGKITGDYTLSVIGGLTLSGTTNDFTGNLGINGTAGPAGGNPVTVKLGANEVIPNGVGKGNVIISGSGTFSAGLNLVTLDLNGKTETINGLATPDTLGGVVSSVGITLGNARVTNSNATASTLILGDNNQTAAYSGTILDGAGTIALTKIGAGRQTLSGANGYTGATTINGGSLKVDFTTVGSSSTNTPSNYINGSSALTLGGGTLEVLGRANGGTLAGGTTWTGATTSPIITVASTAGLVVGQALTGTNLPAGAYITYLTATTITMNGVATATSGTVGASSSTVSTSQSFASTTLNAGASGISLNANSGNGTVVNLNALTRNNGSTLNVTLPSGTQSSANGVTTTSTSFTNNGILASAANGTAFATVGGTDWAALSSGNIVAYTGYTSDTWASGNNTTVTTSSSPTSGSTTNSLRFNAAGANTLTLAGINTLASGGILVTGNVGNNLSTISGGTLQGSTVGKDLVVIQNNILNGLTIGSIIADNSTATSLTKSGAGFLTLSGANSYTGATYVNEGKVTVGSTGTINGTSGVSIGAGEFNYNSSTALSQGVSFTSTGGTLSGGGTITPAVTVTLGNTLSPGNSIGTLTFGTGLTIAGTYAAQLGTAGTTPATGVSDLAAVTGNLILTGGTLSLSDNAGANGNGSAGAGAYRLATYTGSLTGTFASVTNPLSSTLHEKVIYTNANEVDLNLYRLATANAIGTPVSLGNAHVGGTLSQALSIQNTAANDGFSEGLNASGGSLTGSAITSGSVVNLAAGSTNNSSLLVGLGTGTAGAVTGTVVIGLSSNGTGTSGYGNTGIASQTVTVNGGVYNLASANTIATPVSLTNVHVGGTFGTSAVTLTNTAAAGSYSEKLDAAFTGTTGSASNNSGTVSLLAAQGSDTTSLVVGLGGSTHTGTAGAVTGTTTLGLASNGSGTSGLGTTSLTAQTITVNGGVYNLASANTITTPVNLTNVHVGGTFGTSVLTLTNTAASGSYSEKLDAAFTGTTGQATNNSGTVSLLAAQASDTTSLIVGLGGSSNTGTSGNKSGTVTVGLTSNGSGTSGLGTTALSAQVISVSGVVYDYAAPLYSKTGGTGSLTGSGTSYTLDFGSGLAINTTYTANISLANGGAVNLYQDNLGGSFSSLTSGFGTTATTFSGLVAGSADSFNITFNTGSGGTFNSALTLAGTSQNSGGLGNSSLGNYDIALVATAVPEPSTWALLAFSLTTVMVLRRRRA